MVPFPNKKIMQTQWIPGGMQNVRFEVFKNELFDGKIRMYGEDVEFYSRKDKKQTKYKLFRYHSCNPVWYWLVFIASKIIASSDIIIF